MIDAAKRVAPYLPFATFLSSLDAFTQGVPPKLDRTLWRSQSGFVQGLIMNAYRFFGLVDEDDNDSATDYLVNMVRNKEQRPKILRDLLYAQYEDILEGHDLTKMTMKMLESQFEKSFAVTGTTKQKAIAFFLKAAKFAEMPLSTFLASQLRNAAPRKKRAKQRLERTNGDEEETLDDGLPPISGAVTHTVQLASGGTVSVIVTANPFTMPLEDRNFVFSMIDMVQKYEAQKQGEK